MRNSGREGECKMKINGKEREKELEGERNEGERVTGRKSYKEKELQG